MTIDGFHGRAGFGTRPALVVVDVNLGFTDPTSPLVCDLDECVAAIARLLDVFRSAGLPVVYTTVCYDDFGKQAAAVFIEKVPALLVLEPGSEWVEIDPRIAPLEGEPVLSKYFASAFFGTTLASVLATAGCDTVVVTGASTSGCVRATALDALQHGYRVVVPREAVGDRNPAAHEANLYDIDAKYGDVVSMDEVLTHVEEIHAGGGDVIVRDLGDAWQVVLQTDHADLAASFARAWATPLEPSLVTAVERHDDGWAVWEQAPRIDESGKPVNFLEVDILSHLAFYRAGIAAITEQDPDAGLLVSMHGAGIYRQRYGIDPALGLARAGEAEAEVEAFVAEQEAKFGGAPGDRQADYELLQLFDRLSLYFCMRDLPGGEPAELQGYTLEPVGPWRVKLAPYPFAESPGSFTLVRRVLPKDGGAGVLAAPPQATAITIDAG